MVNVPVSVGDGVRVNSAILPDGAGGAIVAWQDTRTGESDIYAQHVLANGDIDPAWPVGGLALCTATSYQHSPLVVSDAAGGAIVAWLDTRHGTAGREIYGQHVLPNGTLDPAWPADGLFICNAVAFWLHRAIADGDGGVIVAWMDDQSGSLDIYAHHAMATGILDPSWPSEGTLVCTALGIQISPDIVSDGAGGAIVAWEDYRNGDPGVYAQHVLFTGSVDASWPGGGIAVPAANWRPRLVGDGAGGAIVAWQDQRTGDWDIYAQHILASGQYDPAWPTGGRALCQGAGNQQTPAILPDGAGGAIVAWEDYRNGSTSVGIYAQRILASGAVDPAWPTNGIALCANAGFEGPKFVALVEDGGGGALVTWSDKRNGYEDIHFDIYAQRVLASGTIPLAWPANGRPLCSAAGGQSRPALAPDANGGAIATWTDERGFNAGIYAQRVQGNGQLGDGTVSAPGEPEPAPALALDRVCPNPSQRGALTLHFGLASAAPAWLELVDVSGRRIAAREVGSLGPGRHSFDLGTGVRLSAGLYFVRLRQGTSVRVQPVTVLN